MERKIGKAPCGRMLRAGFALALVSVSVSVSAAHAATADVSTRLKALNDLLAAQWEWTLKDQPEFATTLGDYRYNDRLSDLSLAHVEEQKRATEDFLHRFEAIDTSGFAEQDRLNQQLMVRQLKDNLTNFAFKNYEMPEDQFQGAHLALAQFVSLIPFDSTRHYEDYLARLHQMPREVDQLIELMKQGEKDKLIPPRLLLDKVATQTRAIAEPAGEQNVFGQPVAKFPDAVPEADRKRLHDAIVAAVDKEVRPAFARLAEFVEKDYAPKGRKDLGLWALPDGAARYRFQIHQQTTTDMDPEAIHQLGLAQVQQIESQMSEDVRKLGYADLKAFRAAIKTDPAHHAKSREQILDLYRGYIAKMQPELPKLFGLLPKTQVQVRPVEAFREKEAPFAEYLPGTPDGSRPGAIYVNTGDYANRLLLNVEATAYHEGVPGHHLQIAIAQTLPGLPPFRQQAGYTAYIEGWALYSERLGKDIGFYQDPYSELGRLSNELMRADRLVLDTGVHYKHWTREQMVDFFHAHSDLDEPTVQAETDRYIAAPAQALCYKLGQLKILELREKAKKALGDRFDIKAFHDEILDGGALPLDVLDQRVSAWIESQQKTDQH